MVAESALRKRESTSVEPERIQGGRMYQPRVDIVEEEDRLLIYADVPGVQPDDLEVNYERGELTIHGRVQPRPASQESVFLLREYGVGDFCRSFQVGEGIDPSKIEAEFHEGVLTLHLPKTRQAMPRRITVKAH